MIESATHSSNRSPASIELYFEVLGWMNREAELLDTLHEAEWLETMVSREIVYQMPVRQTVRRAEGSGFLSSAFHLDETYGSLATRIARTKTNSAWGEDPPSRSRHFVSNLRVSAEVESGIEAASSLLLYRTRGDQSIGNLMSCERLDLLRRQPDGLRLLRRTVLLDVSVIETHNLAVIL